MRTPAAIIAGAIVPAGISSGVPSLDDKKDGKIAAIVRRLNPIMVVAALTNQLIAIVWATVAINQLTETSVGKASSVWHLLLRDYQLEWAGVNAHFFLGMIQFMFVIGSRLYLTEPSRGAIGKSFAGFAASGLFLMVGIINRGISAGNQDGLRFGPNVLSLFYRYIKLLIKRSTYQTSFGSLTLVSIVICGITVLSSIKAIWTDVQPFKKKRWKQEE